jgi:hypothetical protein
MKLPEILDQKETQQKIRNSNLESIELLTQVLLVGVLILEGWVCWFSWDYFIVFILSISFSIGAIQYVWRWKRITQLHDKQLEQSVLIIPKRTKSLRWSIMAVIALKTMVVLFFGRIFYFGLQAGISLTVFPAWQLLLPFMNLLLVICLLTYLILTKKAQANGRITR